MKRKITHLQLTPRTRQAANVLAAMRGQSLSDFVAHLVDQEVDAKGLREVIGQQIEEEATRD